MRLPGEVVLLLLSHISLLFCVLDAASLGSRAQYVSISSKIYGIESKFYRGNGRIPKYLCQMNTCDTLLRGETKSLLVKVLPRQPEDGSAFKTTCFVSIFNGQD